MDLITPVATTPQVFAQQTGQGGAAKFYERGPVRIRYNEAGSGFPLLLIAGGALNSRMAGLLTSPFNSIEEFKGEYRCIFADLRNANGGESTGPLEIDRPWDSHTDDHLGLMDHLGVDKFLTKMYRSNPDFVYTVTRDFVRNCQTPVLVLPDDIPAHPYAVAMECAMLAPKAEVSIFPWKEPKERIPLAVRQVRSFLRAHRPAAA